MIILTFISRARHGQQKFQTAFGVIYDNLELHLILECESC